MRFLSLFSGIEAASSACYPLGWEAVAFSEIDPFACSVLAHHYPSVPNLGDVTKITEEQIASLGHIDVVIFGSPCQDLSLAGKRKGFIDESDGSVTRSGLFFTAMQLFSWAHEHCGARFAWWENVAGAYSSNKGEDFASVVAEMAGLRDVGVPKNGWGSEGCAVGDNGMLEWACMDAQWFGVAQRRRRVFAVLDTGDWSNRQPILLERNSLRGDSPPSREAGESVTGTIAARTQGGGGLGTDFECTGGLQPVIAIAFGGNNTTGPIDVATTRNACASGSGRMDFESETFITYCVHGTQDPCFSNSTAFALGRNNGQENAIAFNPNQEGMGIGCVAAPIGASTGGVNQGCVAYTTKLHNTKSNNAGKIFEERTVALDANSPPPALLTATQVRRLTPEECEVLQGFSRGFTRIPRGKKPAKYCPDGPRYKAIGNSMAVPVIRWIGKKIEAALNGEVNQ